MKLSSLLQELQAHHQKWEEYDAYVLRLANGTKEGPEADYDEFPIFEIDIETEDKEITFLTNRLATEAKTEKQPIKVKDLAKRLLELEPECADFDLFSGSEVVDIGDGYSGRVDVPICSSGWDDQNNRFAMLEQIERGLSKRQKLAIYLIGFIFWTNLYVFIGLFVEIVLPNLLRSGVWSYLQLAVGMALIFAVAESLKEKTFLTFVGFNVLVAVMNVLAIWRHFYLH